MIKSFLQFTLFFNLSHLKKQLYILYVLYCNTCSIEYVEVLRLVRLNKSYLLFEGRNYELKNTWNGTRQRIKTNCVKSVPIQGIADSILVITVAKLSNHIR